MAHLSATASASTTPALRATRASNRRPSARTVLITRAATNDGLGNYLSKAAAQVFSPLGRGVNWTTTPFTGQIAHHEKTRHGHFASDVKTRQNQQQLVTLEPEVSEKVQNSFLVGLQSLFNGNFSNSGAYDKNEPRSFGGHTGFPSDIARNQREISRLLSLTKDDRIKPPRL